MKLQISKLTDAAANEVFDKIFAMLKEMDFEDKRTFMACFIEGTLNELDEEDFFGTEGWEHRAGLDD